MPWQDIPNTAISTGRAITQDLLERMRANLLVPKAPQGCDILTEGSGTWSGPDWAEQIKVTCVGGGSAASLGTPFVPRLTYGRRGGAGIIWHEITPGTSFAWRVGGGGSGSDDGEPSNFGTLISCTGGGNVALNEPDGAPTFGTNVSGVRFRNDLGHYKRDLTGDAEQLIEDNDNIDAITLVNDPGAAYGAGGNPNLQPTFEYNDGTVSGGIGDSLTNKALAGRPGVIIVEF